EQDQQWPRHRSQPVPEHGHAGAPGWPGSAEIGSVPAAIRGHSARSLAVTSADGSAAIASPARRSARLKLSAPRNSTSALARVQGCPETHEYEGFGFTSAACAACLVSSPACIISQ